MAGLVIIHNRNRLWSDFASTIPYRKKMGQLHNLKMGDKFTTIADWI